ncbi:hypothetical protein [Microcoleus sp. herbarium14]
MNQESPRVHAGECQYRCLELQVWEYIACLTGEQEVYRPMKWDQ